MVAIRTSSDEESSTRVPVSAIPQSTGVNAV